MEKASRANQAGTNGDYPPRWSCTDRGLLAWQC